VTGREDEGEFYREIVRRARRVRERAAESLRLSRAFRKGKEDKGSPGEQAPKPQKRRQNGRS
jgi:hypothetical protein